MRKDVVNQRVLSEVYKEFNESRVHIEEAVSEAKATLNLLFPDFREDESHPSESVGSVQNLLYPQDEPGPSTSTKPIQHVPERVVVSIPSGVAVEKSEDNLEILNSLKDSQKLLTSNLANVSVWLRKVTKHGGSGPVVDSLLKLQTEMKNELARCKGIKVIEKRKALINKKVEDFSDSDDDDGFESVDLSIKDPEGLGDELTVEANPPVEKPKPPEVKPVLDPNPLKRRKVAKNDDQDSSKISAPILPYGLDLKYWGEEVTPAEVPKNNVDDHGFWRPPDEGYV